MLVEKWNRRKLRLYQMRQLGLSVFSTPFNTYDGFGDGPFDPAETDSRALGMRPSLQGNGLVLRINGLDAQSCNECHTIVRSSTRPPTLSIGGVGGLVQQAMIMSETPAKPPRSVAGGWLADPSTSTGRIGRGSSNSGEFVL